MSLSVGARLGSYEILGLLGVGGMGEVYRAKDTTLSREIAIKVLPAALSQDAERLARFEREARLLAALNHPNIAAIYGLQRENGVPFLVLELAPGRTLAEVLAGGRLEIPEALRIGKQIAEALESAHERGIIHRDLKPANIKITPEGKVKVLDFGLAKAFCGEGALSENSPTVSLGETRDGAILGTVAYMSPEQARGRPLDKRTDVWSFGCVLYEALAGRRAFAGETLSDTLASVLKHEPDVDSLPSAIPANIRVLLRRCLHKEREHRLRDVGDARIEIDETLGKWGKEDPRVSAVAHRRERWIIFAATLGGLLLGSIITWPLHRPGSDQRPKLLSATRLTHDPEFSETPTWSPDGKQLAFASNRSGNFEIYVRRVEGGQDVNVSNNPAQDFQPALSPDGNWIAFVSTRSSRTGMVKIGSTIGTEFRTLGGDVWLTPTLGGQARLVAKDANFPARHPSGHKLAYMSGPEQHRSILEVLAEGGTPKPLLSAESSAWEIVRMQYSPGANWVTFETWDREIFILPVGGGSPRKLLSGVSHVWDPSGKYLFYCTRDLLGGTRLESVDIDESKGELRSESHTLSVMTGLFHDLSISHDGQQLVLVVSEGAMNLTRLTLTADGGSPAGPEQVLSRGDVFDRSPDVSPDSRTIAYCSNRLGLAELWVYHLTTNSLGRLELLGRDLGVFGGTWFPDGRRLLVVVRDSSGRQSLWTAAADGSQAAELFAPPESMLSTEGIPVSPDGRHVVYPARVGQHHQLFSLDIESRQVRQITTSPDDKFNSCWSRDGRWLVYPSNASGDVQLWRIPATGGQPQRLTKSNDRIRHGFYSSDGRWLYFQPNHLNIYRMPADGGPVQQVTHFPEAGLFIEEPTISPDNRYLVYSRSNGGSSLWSLKIGAGKAASN